MLSWSLLETLSVQKFLWQLTPLRKEGGGTAQAWKVLPDKLAYFKLKGTSFTLYLAQVNANLSELSDGPLKDKQTISRTEKDMEIAESLTRKFSAL